MGGNKNRYRLLFRRNFSLIGLLIMILAANPAYALDELMENFDDDESVPVLNEELRKISDEFDDVDDSITAVDTKVDSAGRIIQVAHTVDTAVATGSTAIPADDTVPASTEGDEYITLSITPQSADSDLIIHANVVLDSDGANIMTVALFKDSGTSAIAAVATEVEAGDPETFGLVHEIAAGAASSQTFKIRAGTSGGDTVTFNGTGGSRLYGGVSSSTITIYEVQG